MKYPFKSVQKDVYKVKDVILNIPNIEKKQLIDSKISKKMFWRFKRNIQKRDIRTKYS